MMAPGVRCMVVDCGGGTVDITAYENDEAGRMVEIGRVAGGRHGSEYLNRAFEDQLLVQRFGKAEVLEDLRENLPAGLLDLTDAWERAKLHIALDQAEPVYLSIPAAVDRHLGPTMRKRLARLQDGVSDAIVITPDECRALFETLVPDILDLIDEQLSEMRARTGPDQRGRDAVLLVGGFSASPYLQQAVHRHVGEAVDVLLPPDPNVAVLFGAAHFCYEPQTRARRARFTYGVRTCKRFQDGVDPLDSLHVSKEGVRFCDTRITRFVSAGDIVVTDAEYTHDFVPIEPDQSALTIPLFASTDPDVRYVTDPACDQIGVVEVDLSRVMRFAWEDRNVRVYMKFGETEVHVRAEVVASGEAVQTSVRFHSNY
jgi:hypothetical protein